MLAKIGTATLCGVDAAGVTVEADVERGMPITNIVGLPDVTVKEALVRVPAAIRASGWKYPAGRITVNMAPAGLPKRGSHFDLAIAAAVLYASGQMGAPAPADGSIAMIGELSLDGTLKRIPGALSMAMALRDAGWQGMILPRGNLEEASLVQEIDLYPAEDLNRVLEHLSGKDPIRPVRNAEPVLPSAAGNGDIGSGNGDLNWKPEKDFAEIRGQEMAKRAIMIAAAGRHGLLMTGSPAAGKTMLAERIPTILPEMSREEMLRATRIWSVAGLLSEEKPLIRERPFRQPGPRTTQAALLGGGKVPRPGEISLADGGVLFLDEVSAFAPQVLDALRIPLEEHRVTISRAHARYVFPANILLVMARNPCKCGYLGDPRHTCTCSENEIRKYQAKLSGPLLDRIDLHLRLLPAAYDMLRGKAGMGSAEMRQMVLRARKTQRLRFGTGEHLNGDMSEKELERYAALGPDSELLLKQAYDGLGLDPRTLLKTRRIARTIADLEGEDQVLGRHIAEALGYRERREMGTVLPGSGAVPLQAGGERIAKA